MTLIKNLKSSIFLILFLTSALVVTACGKRDSDCLAVVKGRELRQQDLDKALDYYNKVEANPDMDKMDEDQKAEELKKVKKLLLDQLVWDLIVEEDSNKRGINSEGLFLKLKADALQKLVDEDGLKRQLESLGISMEDYEESLRKEAMNLAHRSAVVEENEPKDSDLKKYYEKHDKERKLIDYEEAVVGEKTRAKDIEKDWEGKKSVSDPGGLNTDSFEESSYKEYKNMGIDDDKVVSSKIFDMKEGACQVFKNRGLYHVVHISKITEDFTSVKNHLQKMYEKDIYLEYMKKKSKDFNVRIYKDF